MADKTPKLSVGRRLLGWAVLGGAILFGFLIGHWLTGSGPAPAEAEAVNPFVMSIFLLFVGFFFLGAGTIACLMVHVTRGFTFAFDRPFWKPFKTRLWICNVAVTVLIAIGLGSLVVAFVGPLLEAFGVPETLAFMIPVFVTLLVVQMVLVGVNIWVPLTRSTIRKRLSTYGVARHDLETGRFAGISDPARSSLRKLFIEEDVGMLWLRQDQLVYRGDADSFEARRDQLLEIERATDANSVAAYAGAADVIVRLASDDGGERRVRLHVLGIWTLRGVAKALDELADELEAWRRMPVVAEPER